MRVCRDHVRFKQLSVSFAKETDYSIPKSKANDTRIVGMSFRRRGRRQKGLYRIQRNPGKPSDSLRFNAAAGSGAL